LALVIYTKAAFFDQKVSQNWPKNNQKSFLTFGLVDQVSISPIFYEQLSLYESFFTAFICLKFGFVISWQKNFGAKAAHKMLVKLTPVKKIFMGVAGLRVFSLSL
jgi:hypothetical protein